MIMILEELLWDSNFFSLKVGRLDIDSNQFQHFYKKISSELPSSTYDLIYLFSNVPLILKESVQNYTLTYSGSKTLFEVELTECEHHTASTSIVRLSLNDFNNELYALALASGHLSRFKLDTCIAQQEFEALYKLWIENSLKHEIADEVLAVKLDQELAGFVTLKNNWESAKIGLIAVAEAYRGRGVGTILIQQAKHLAFNAGATTLQVETQGDNLAANALYLKNGFKKLKTDYVCHLRRIGTC